jgi:prolyl-tRNA synthetase
MVQDRKAIQAGTSHFLGQNFARASGIQFHSRAGTQEFGWTTSWGMSTRLIGTVIMAHADDDGLVLPPRIAPAHVVILPVINKPEGREAVLERTKKLAEEIRAQSYYDEKVRVELDLRDLPGGQKKWDWIKKGIPIRIEVGWRDLQSDVGVCFRRDSVEKEIRKLGDVVGDIPTILESIQQNLFERAKQFRDANTRVIDSKEEFYRFFTPVDRAKPEIHGGFALAHWNGAREVEDQIKADLKVTIRCIPFDDPRTPPEAGVCPFSGQPSPRRVVWAKSY